MAKYYVGQKLWRSPKHGRREHGREVTVKTVGRKWVTLDSNMRFDAGEDLPATIDEWCDWQVFESEDHATRYRRLRNNWSALAIHFRHMPMPADMTTERIVAAAKLLGIDVEIVSGKETTDG
jgi:hypothetical protein